MTLTIIPTPITEERLHEIAGPTSARVSVPTSESYVPIADIQRWDYSHLIVEGTRGGDGVLRYFARIDRGGGSSVESASSFEAGGRIPVGEGERITAVYYGDHDGDRYRDVIVRMESGALQVFLVGEAAAASPGSTNTAPPPETSGSGGSHQNNY